MHSNQKIFFESAPLVVGTRGGKVENIYRGSAIALHASGKTILALGGAEKRSFYPRSALKLLQALPLVEKAGESISDKEIALACSSHYGDSVHAEAVCQWLGRLDLSPEDLENGASLPQRKGKNSISTKQHHMCSGKHTGVLALSKAINAPTKGYSNIEHPAGQLLLQTVSELSGLPALQIEWERDGCGLPAFWLPMKSFAQALSYLSAPPQDSNDIRKKSIARIIQSISSYPEMLSGDSTRCTSVIQQTKGEVIVKIGADGVYAGVLPSMKIGFAIKIDDGSSVASGVALGAMLRSLRAISSDENEALSHFFSPKTLTSRGELVGGMEPTEAWSTKT